MRNWQSGWLEGRLVSLQVLVVILTMSTELFGQADRARISGFVTDESQALIPGVEVTALNVDTGVRTAVSTNQVGNYSLINLPIGTYTIRFSLSGFKTFERNGFKVSARRMNNVFQVGRLWPVDSFARLDSGKTKNIVQRSETQQSNSRLSWRPLTSEQRSRYYEDLISSGEQSPCWKTFA